MGSGGAFSGQGKGLRRSFHKMPSHWHEHGSCCQDHAQPSSLLVALSALRLLLWPQHRRIATPGNSPRSGSVRTPVLCSSRGVILGHVLGTAFPGFPSRINLQLSTEVAGFIKEYLPPSLPRMNPSSSPRVSQRLPDKLLSSLVLRLGKPGTLSGRKIVVNTCTTLCKAWEL